MLSRPEIKAQLKNLFDTHVLPQLKTLTSYPMYDGMGVSSQYIEKVIQAFDDKQKKLAKTHYGKTYANARTTGPKAIIDWLQEVKTKKPYQYPHIYQMVKKCHQDYNLPSIEEYLEGREHLIIK